MANAVQPGVNYYEIDDSVLASFADLYTQTGNEYYNTLASLFNYKSPYVSGKSYAPVALIMDDPDLWDFLEENDDLGDWPIAWFRNSMQPGGYL